MDVNDIMSLLEGRRTIRRFDEGRQIPDDAVNDIKRAAQLASSAMNRQPLRYIYVRTPETVNAIFDITSWGGAIPNGEGRPVIGQRPSMFVAILSVKELKSPYTQFDEGLAASNMTLAAYAHGIGSCIIGSVKHEGLKELLNIGDEFDISCVIAFGYPAHKSTVIDAVDGNVTYFMDDNKDYIVPKRTIDDITTNK
jgi:nitroreductase